MTLLESKKLPLPIPEDFKHIRLPLDTWYPAHRNDVRFNFKQQNWGRRCFVHDNYMNSYDVDHDMVHSIGYRDEDLDWDVDHPMSGMHWKKKRSSIFWFSFLVIWASLFFGYATLGLKLPQVGNPTFWRKKYASPGAIHQ